MVRRSSQQRINTPLYGGKSIKHNKEKIKSQLDELWKYAQNLAADERLDTSPVTFAEVNAERGEQTIASINAALAEQEDIDPKVKQKLKYAEKHWPGNLRKYEGQEKLLAGRNSYSKTDPDATFMRMKEDHMLNGQLSLNRPTTCKSAHRISLFSITHFTRHRQTTRPFPHTSNNMKPFITNCQKR